jgi:arylsulfatase A-like enzyme
MSLIVPAMLPVVAIAVALVAYGPAAKHRERIPARPAIAFAALVLAALLPLVGLGTPSEATRIKVENESFVGPNVIKLLRSLIDRDGDKHSGFFGGPDCDDSDPDVNPEATEIAENGKDDNCIGGDGKRDTPVKPSNGGTTAVKSTLSGGKNLLVIFIDTLRHDRLGFTGYQRDGKSLTPNIDKLAGESVVFEKAFAQAPNTPRSVPSFLGSRYPTQIAYEKGRRTNYPTVLDSNELLFEVLQPKGFKTIGMTSHFYFCDRVKQPDTCQDVFKSMASNIQQGAAEWDNTETVDIGPSNKDISGPRIVKKTSARLEQLAKDSTQFAMLVHFAEPHSTYMVYDEHPITERGDASLEQRYDYEILEVDKRVGELLETLDKTGLAKTTTVVLLSDHGEAFGVHRVAGQRMFFHGQTLYRELIHVPLIWRVPGVAPRKATDVVQLIDLAPTVTELFKLEPPAAWQGRSLVPALEGKPLDPKPAYAELVPVPDWEHTARSMITGDGKRHVLLMDGKTWEIYDLEADPAETKNLADEDPAAEELKGQLTRWTDRGQ